MSGTERDGIERVIDLCLEARERLDGPDACRLRILLDMLLLELGRELARLMTNGRA